MESRFNRDLTQILIDARFVGPYAHGFSRYLSGLALGLKELQTSGTPLSYEPVFIVSPNFKSKDFFGFETRVCDIPFLSRTEIFGLGAWIKNEIRRHQAKKISLFHSPTFASFIGLPIPWIMTLHDLNHLYFGTVFQKIYYLTLLKGYAKRALQLHTGSEASRYELSQWLNLPANQIQVVPNSITMGADPLTQEEERLKQTVAQRPYWFCLTNAKKHKNVELLLKAYQAYRSQITQGAYPLVLSLSEENTLTVVRGNTALLKNVHFLPRLSDALIHDFIRGSIASLCPSRYEGFGLVPVESAVLGAPVIVSDIPQHRESLSVCSTSLAWADPNDEKQWAQTLVDCDRRYRDGTLKGVNPEIRNQILENYRPLRAAQVLDQFYQKALESCVK